MSPSLSVIISDREWDVLLLIPGAVLGALLGLGATLWWNRLHKKRSERRAEPNETPSRSTRTTTTTYFPGDARGGSASATATATSSSSAAVTLTQIQDVPSQKGGRSSWFDNAKPEEILVVFVATAFAVTTGYAWARPAIESVLLVVGSVGAGLSVMLLLPSLAQRSLDKRLVFVLTASALVFVATMATPWVIESATYPFKDYGEVLRLIGSRPVETSQLYGLIGVTFLIEQLVGVVIMGFAALLAFAVLGATVLGVGAVLGDKTAARLQGFRQRSIGLSVRCLLCCVAGLWIVHGGMHRITDRSDAYAHDQQRPHIFEVTLNHTRGRRMRIALRVDEPVRLTVGVTKAGRRREIIVRRFHVLAGAHRFGAVLPAVSRRVTAVVRVRGRDRAGRKSGVRVFRVTYRAR